MAASTLVADVGVDEAIKAMTAMYPDEDEEDA